MSRHVLGLQAPLRLAHMGCEEGLLEVNVGKHEVGTAQAVCSLSIDTWMERSGHTSWKYGL